MASRSRSIRTRIIALLAVPLVSLLALWSFAALITLGDAQRLLNLKTLDVKLVRPTDDVLVALKNERRMSVSFLGGDKTLDRSGFDAQRTRTDQARRAFLTTYQDAGLRNGVIGAETARRIDSFADNLKDLDTTRRLVDSRAIARDAALDSFTALLDGAYAIYGSLTLPDAALAGEGKTYIALNRAQEILNREDALITGALAHGRISAAEHAHFGRLVSTQRAMHQDAIPGLPDAARKRLEEFLASPDFTAFQTLEDRILRNPQRAGQRPPISIGSWHIASETALTKLASVERTGYDEMTVRANDIARRTIIRLGLAGGLGLVAVIASVVIATRASRKIIRENKTLARAVEEFGRDRLPKIAEAVQKNQHFDPEADAPALEFSVTEVDKVYRAFVEARRAVVTATVQEAAVRKGVSEVFVNLARRNQTLLHRQLNLLDNMERRADDPDELDDLFRLDHLATRMRRHAEGLVILSGKSAGRSWRNPVPLVDVARGAIAEVEDYTRVRVLPMTRVALIGTAVADTIHLLAELIENATLFSPPELPVQVGGQMVANGFVIEIEDRGLGLSSEALAEANDQLANPPEFDPAESTRLGLFVVARLAHRHDIKVSLRISPYGGTTAIVLVPSKLIVEVPEEPRPAGIEPAQSPGMRSVPETGSRAGVEQRSESGAWAVVSAIGGPTGSDRATRSVPSAAMATANGASVTSPPATAAHPGNGAGGVYGPRYDDSAESHPSHDGLDGLPQDATDAPDAPDAGPRTGAATGSGRATAAGDAPDPAAVPPAERPAGLPEGLPFRKRQANLAPQLQDRAAGTDPEPSAGADTAGPGVGAGAAGSGVTGVSGVSGGHAEPGAPARRSESGAPGAPSEPGEPGEAGGDRGAAAGDRGEPGGRPAERTELPRRRRQANLAPQLRAEGRDRVFGADRTDLDTGSRPVVPPEDWEPADEVEADRPPEAVRSMMAAMQQGWKRGRVEAGQADNAAGPPVRSGTERSGTEEDG